MGKHHGMTDTRLHKIWRDVKKRCKDKNNEHYGGRGIGVCDEWALDFIAFYNWSVSNGYTDDLSIDRIDNNGNYEPSNCRWVTQIEQANNKRNNRLLKYQKWEYTYTQWARKIGILPRTMYARSEKGWNDEDVLLGRRQKEKNRVLEIIGSWEEKE